MSPPPVDIESQKLGSIDIQARALESHHEGHPRTVEPGARFPIEYQTLSIHVDNSTQPEKGGLGNKRGKFAAKGRSINFGDTLHCS